MRALLPCVLACLLGVSAAQADSLVNDRSLDAFGDAQYTPHVAVINTLSGLNLVCVWERLTVGQVRDYRIGISQNPMIPGYGWVMHGSPPAPAGYLWISDVQVVAPSIYYGLHGRFLIVGQVRTPSSPYTFGLASVRGVVDDENTLTWDMPQLIETFGSQLVQSRYVGAVSADVEPNSDNVYLGYVRLLTDAASNSLWFRTSTDLGVTWSARSFVGNDSTRSTSDVWIKCGAFPGWATFFYLAANDTNSYSLYSKDTFSYGASFNPLQLVRTVPATYQTSPFGLRNEIGAPGLEIDRSTSLYQYSMYAGYAEEIDHGAVAYPAIGSSPARSSVEPDGHAALANPATPGTVLRGTMSGGAPPDTDVFVFSLAAGQSVEAHIDSAAVPGIPMLWCGPDGVSWLTRATQNCEFAAPVAGNYYLVLTTGSFAAGGYRIRTVSTPPPAGQARDPRDAFVSAKPFFGPWSPKVNASAQTTPVGYDESGLRLTANLDGSLYAGWCDWSAQPAKQISRFTVSRSGDGGQTWGALHSLPAVNSDWTHVPVPTSSMLVGPWGDVASDGKAMYFVWTDARNGDADV